MMTVVRCYKQCRRRRRRLRRRRRFDVVVLYHSFWFDFGGLQLVIYIFSFVVH